MFLNSSKELETVKFARQKWWKWNQQGESNLILISQKKLMG